MQVVAGTRLCYNLFYMGRITWKLKRFIEGHNLKARQVETEAIRLGYTFGRNTIYRLLKDEGPVNINRDSLTAVIAALRSLTGRKVKVGDLLEYEE